MNHHPDDAILLKAKNVGEMIQELEQYKDLSPESDYYVKISCKLLHKLLTVPKEWRNE